MGVNKKIILVTGHAGFIGSHLVSRLLKNGYKVVGVDNYNDYYDVSFKEKNIKKFRKNSNFKEFKGDIRDLDFLKDVFRKNKIDVVAHLAARAGVRPSIENPKLYEDVNINGTRNLLKIARKYKVKQFIFASSSSVYGEQEKIPFSENDKLDEPRSPYAKTKLKAEKLCNQFANQSGIMTTVLRFFTVYGPKGRPDMAPYLFTKKVLSNEPVIRFGDGSSSRDYTYIDDIVDGIVKAIKHPFRFEIINLGNNRPIQLNKFIYLIGKITNKKVKIIERPRHQADVLRTYADIGKAEKLLGWRPKTNLETGLKQFINWFMKQ